MFSYCYLVIVCFTVGQALAFVVTVSQEGFLTLCTHKMLQTNPQPGTLWLTQLSASTWSHYQVRLSKREDREIVDSGKWPLEGALILQKELWGIGDRKWQELKENVHYFWKCPFKPLKLAELRSLLCLYTRTPWMSLTEQGYTNMGL